MTKNQYQLLEYQIIPQYIAAKHCGCTSQQLVVLEAQTEISHKIRSFLTGVQARSSRHQEPYYIY